MLIKALDRSISELGLAGHNVLVAVSGGLDSVVLLHGLTELAAAHRITLSIGHVRHGLRGEESEADADFVRRLAAALCLDFRCERVSPHALREGRSNRERPTVQEAARSLRRQALFQMADLVGAELIATAHNLDDQAETVLMRLFRGAGPDGLGGIPERSPDGRIVRPLLAIARSEIQSFAGERHLEWREDSSNASLGYTRNRLRHQWLPELAAAFNPQLLRAIANLAEAQRRDSEWIEALVDEVARVALVAQGEGIDLAQTDWVKGPPALARRVIRRAVTDLGGGRDVTRVHLERMLDFIRAGIGAGHPATLELPGGLTLRRSVRGFHLVRCRV